MKSDIHPTFFPEARVTCSCGASFTVGSTKETLQVEICSQCHPFFTGNEKVIDTAGRVEKFNRKRAAAQTKKPVKKKVVAKPEAAVETTEGVPAEA
jgi:large subunit ribosomal protein L31